jgi:site-specific recombinase XerD
VEAVVRLDRRGRPYTKIMVSELRRGQAPPNKGKRYPAELYTDEDVTALLGYYDGEGHRGRPPVVRAGVRNTAVILLMWRCGLRIAEVLALDLDDIDLAEQTVVVRHGKGDKRRLLGVPDDALTAVQGWLSLRATLDIAEEHEQRLFVTVAPDWMGQELLAPRVREMLKRLAKRTGVRKRVHPHGFRHTFAVNMLRSGNHVRLIQLALGHEDLETTAGYLDHVSNEDLISAMRGRPHLRLVGGSADAGAEAAYGRRGDPGAPYADLMDVFARAGRDELQALGDLFHRLAAEAA